MSTTVTVRAPYQVAHAGVVFTPGMTADVPDDVAARWIAAGWVELAPETKPPTKPPAKRR